MRLGLICVSPLLFAIACCVPALEFNQSQGGLEPMWGANILLTGWSGIFAGVLGWYANPFLLAGLITAWFRRKWVAVVFGLIAIAIGCTTFSLFGRQLPADEGNVNHMTMVRLLPGFYFWMCSLVALPITAFLANL